jgi:hypothetical protein
LRVLILIAFDWIVFKRTFRIIDSAGASPWHKIGTGRITAVWEVVIERVVIFHDRPVLYWLNVWFLFVLFDNHFLVIEDVLFGNLKSVFRGVLETPFRLLYDLKHVSCDFLRSFNGEKKPRVLKINWELDSERGVTDVLHDKSPCIIFHFLFGLKLFSRHPDPNHGRRALVEFWIQLINQQKPPFFGSGIGQAQIPIIELVLKR